MKKLLFLSFIISSPILFAQNIDATRFFMMEYSVPPRSQEFSTATKFFIEMGNGANLELKRTIENEINPNYYTVVGDKSIADVYFQVSSTNVIVNNKKYSATTEQRTDSKGNKYNVTTYKYDGSYKYTVMIEMFNSQGGKIKSTFETYLHNVTLSNTDRSRAEQDFDNKRLNEESTWMNSLALKSFNFLEAEYFFALEKVNVTPLKVKSRKHDYTNLNEAADLVLTWLDGKSMNIEDENIKKAIAVYETELQDLNELEKKARVNGEIGALCNFMLALIHFNTKNYSKAFELIQISETLDKRLHFSQEALKDACQKLKDKKAF